MESNFDNLMVTMSSLVNKIRNEQQNINFVQIGSHDCLTYEDLPSKFININDYGHYVEPVSKVFEDLVLK